MAADRDIIIKEKSDKYNVTAEFEDMPNGETRFRLIWKNDGTAYIKTKTKEDTEGWQNAHYHRGLSETYEVQEGSIIFVEFRNQEITYRKYNSGETFTTEKMIPHNVYMMKDSVIHTIKHGLSVPHPDKNGADWWDDGDGCEQLNSSRYPIEFILYKISKNKEQAKHISDKCIPIVLEKKEPSFSKTYIHFDNLIWQFPIWIFTLTTILVMVIGLKAKDSENNVLFDLGNTNVIGGMFIGLGILGAFLSYAMYRFRCHQTSEKKQLPEDLISPQTLIHNIFSNVLIAILIFIGIHLLFVNVIGWIFIGFAITAIPIISIRIERSLQKIKMGKKQVRMS